MSIKHRKLQEEEGKGTNLYIIIYLQTIILVDVSEMEDVEGIESDFAEESRVELSESTFIVVL